MHSLKQELWKYGTRIRKDLISYLAQILQISRVIHTSLDVCANLAWNPSLSLYHPCTVLALNLVLCIFLAGTICFLWYGLWNTFGETYFTCQIYFLKSTFCIWQIKYVSPNMFQKTFRVLKITFNFKLPFARKKMMSFSVKEKHGLVLSPLTLYVSALFPRSRGGRWTGTYPARRGCVSPRPSWRSQTCSWTTLGRTSAKQRTLEERTSSEGSSRCTVSVCITIIFIIMQK